MKSKRYCLHLFAQPDAANSAGADIDFVNLFHLAIYLSLAQMRVVQREFQHGLFQIPISPIFVVMILSYLPLKPLRAGLVENVSMPFPQCASASHAKNITTSAECKQTRGAL